MRREIEAEAIAASTSMEGVPVTTEEVRRILAGQSPSDVNAEDRALVEGYRDAMSFVLRRADDQAFAWTPELIIGLHDRVLAGRYAEGAGRMRTERPVYIIDSRTGAQVFLPAPGEEVPVLIDDLCRQMSTWSHHPAIASAWVHVALAAIHPFRDGNGRASRVLASLAMYRGGFERHEFTSLEEWWGRHIADYYASFACLGETFDAGADVTPFIESHVKAQLSQVRALDLRERVQRVIWDALDEVTADAGLDQRMTNGLWDAFFGRDITAGYYRSLADISPATATNDLARMVASGLLRAEGQRRGRRYFGTDLLANRVCRVLSIDASGPLDASRDQIVAELTKRVTG